MNKVYLVLICIFIYTAYILKFSYLPFVGDEKTYFDMAYNLVNGYFSPPAPNWNFVAGPGYPLVLMPFIYFSIPLIYAKLLNGLFVSLAICFIYCTLNFYISQKKAFIYSLIILIVIFIYDRYSKFIYTEPLTLLLISLFQYFTIKYLNKRNLDFKKIFILAIIFSFLCHVKIIFFYVALSIIPIYLILSIILRQKINFKIIAIFILSLSLSIPYLIYTYSVTGKFLFFGGSRDTLYWMTASIKDEYGDWIPISEEKTNNTLFYQNHKTEIDSLLKMNTESAEKFYSVKSFNNLKSKPLTYVSNVFSNSQRIFLGFPFSYKFQKPSPRILLNSLIFLLLILSLVIATVKIKKMEIQNIILQLILCIYLGGSILLSGDMRQLFIIYPLLFVMFIYLWFRFIRIKIL